MRTLTARPRKIIVALFVSAIFLATTSAVSGQGAPNNQEPNQPLDASASPRIERLKKELDSGNRAALNQFWREMQASHAPLIEPLPKDKHSSLVTLVWRGNSDTRYVILIGGLPGTTLSNNKMFRLANTDLWYKTYKARNDARFTYAISPNDSLVPFEEIDPKDRDRMDRRFAELNPDPLNPLRDPGGSPSSYVELSEAPPQPWIVRLPNVARGKVIQTRFKSAILDNERDVWVYTPPGFDPNGPRYPLLVVFDGETYIDTVPVPVILDNLIAKRRIPPIVAISVGNPTAASRATELPCSSPFADFLAQELVPWMQTNYRATNNAQQILVGGSSFGGLAAMFAGFKHPEVFGNILSQSGSFWWKPKDETEPEWLTAQLADRPALPLQVFLNVGLMEEGRTTTGPSMLDTNRRMRDVLEKKGYRIQYEEFNGGHRSS